MSQQARKEQEGTVVRRLTAGAGAAALGLAWYFTASATSAVPVAFGAQPAADAGQPVIGVEQLDDHVFVRTVHVAAPAAPAGGVRSARSASGATAPAATTRASGGTTTTSAPIAQAVPAPAAPAPTPVATTGGSTPAK
ncbi:MAG: hypothetical protein E6J41_27295 [Chloroflexi bacterium]|nr:MAG: hypothetical protein E6J41_27295 [Chloroflexota bacterium]